MVSATRHLYHKPLCREWWLLSRTLIVRPDLARFVKALHLSPELSRMPYGYAIPTEVIKYSEQQGGLMSGPLRDGNAHSKAFGMGWEELLGQNTSQPEVFHGKLYYQSAFLLYPPQTIPHLRTVVLQAARTESIIGIATFTSLVQTAPNITTLVFRYGSVSWELPSPLTLDKVTHLDFQACSIDEISLRRVLAACPNLETLELDMIGADEHSFHVEQVTLYEVTRALVRRAPPSLKYVCLYGDDNRVWKDGLEMDRHISTQDKIKQVLGERGINLEIWGPALACPHHDEPSDSDYHLHPDSGDDEHPESD
ncbi:hypothetical protein N656DRAFT_773071 [Canariomyces notabilis]|uniref:Uncharacterized protein n=1 Tax=Canariomyces notabilis TaxID=2074819 RepID=A0AAN6TM60_9PEZI|nr:hypothetical protein N656DRAFT_773071 [Canariomyces arenarius]